MLRPYLVVILLFAALACGDAPAPEVEQAPRMPEPGTYVLEHGEDGVTLLTNQARRSDILRELAALYTFELVLGDAPDPPVALHVVDVGIEEVLELLLEGTPHRLEYDLDPYDGHGTVLRLQVGNVAVGAGPQSGAR